MTVEDLAPCKKLLRFQVPVAEVDEAFKDVTGQFAKKVSLPGFRAGKAPLHIIQKQYSKEIEEEVKRKLMSESYRQGIKDQKLEVLGYPDIEEIQFGQGQEFQFAATIEIGPVFDMPDYRGLPAQREKVKVSEEDVNKALEALRQQKGDFKLVDRALQEGDIAVVNYQGTCDGQPISDLAPAAQGLTQKSGFWVEIKPGSFIPGFTEQLIGAVAGESRVVQIDFPPDFVTAQLAGKHGVYQTQIVEVRERALPPLDDALAKAFGAETLEHLRKGVRQDLQNELNNTQRRHIRVQLVKALSEKTAFDLPESLVEQETRSVVYDIVNENQKRGVSKEVIDKNKDDIYMAARKTAMERVKISFLVQRIAEAEGIRANQGEVNSRILTMAQSYNMPPKNFVKELEKRNGMPEIYQQIIHEKVVDFLQQYAKIEDIETAAPPPADAGPGPAPETNP